jgi:hypothetical protein
MSARSSAQTIPEQTVAGPGLSIKRNRLLSERILVFDGDEIVAWGSWGVVPREQVEFWKRDLEQPPVDGPYVHADTGQAKVLYVDRVESHSPHAFFALAAEIRKIGLPVWTHFSNVRAKAIAELRYRSS